MTEAELNKLLSEVTNVGYKISDLLNKHLDAEDIPEWQANALRQAAAYVSMANSEVFHLRKRMQDAGWWDEEVTNEQANQ